MIVLLQICDICRLNFANIEKNQDLVYYPVHFTLTNGDFMSNDFIMKVGESLIAEGPPGTAAEPEVVIGHLNTFGTTLPPLLETKLKAIQSQ